MPHRDQSVRERLITLIEEGQLKVVDAGLFDDEEDEGDGLRLELSLNVQEPGFEVAGEPPTRAMLLLTSLSFQLNTFNLALLDMATRLHDHMRDLHENRELRDPDAPISDELVEKLDGFFADSDVCYGNMKREVMGVLQELQGAQGHHGPEDPGIVQETAINADNQEVMPDGTERNVAHDDIQSLPAEEPESLPRLPQSPPVLQNRRRAWWKRLFSCFSR